MLKLLEVGLIYPISGSVWVSPVLVVPKKGGMTIIRNEKNDLIPTAGTPEKRWIVNGQRLKIYNGG